MSWEVILASAVRSLKLFEKLNIDRRIDRVRVDNALQTLRQIFFYSSELTTALEDIEASRPVEPEVIEYFINEFQTVPAHIQGALSFIENSRFEDRNVLLIEDIDIMNQIRYGKIDTRREISRFFESYRAELQRGSNRIALDASRILGQIERFNALIKKLEKKLLKAHQGAKVAIAPDSTRQRQKSKSTKKE